MEGSGIKEALSVVYASNSVEKMLNVHALSMIIYKGMEINENMRDFFDGCIENIMNGTMSYDNIEESSDVFNSLVQLLHNKLTELKTRGPTTQLWIQYLDMVSIAHDFIRAERMGIWDDHLTAVKKMLPYFHASGHFLYAKSAHLYLQDMIALEQNMDVQTFENLWKGFFTVKRTDKFNSGTWTDMVIEQTLMKSMKCEGGVSRGRSTQNSVLCKWIYGMHATNAICAEVEKFCNLSFDSTKQHVDMRDSRIKKDNADIQKLVEWFTFHDPFPTTNQIVSILTGIVGDNKINCYKANDIGLQSIKKIIGQTFYNIKLKRSDRVLPISTVSSSVMVHDCKVSIDALLLFQRISLNKKFDEHLREYLQYELSPYPTALFDNGGMRKTIKSQLYQYFEPIDAKLVGDNVTYVIDGGFLLHRVVWQKNDTFSIIINKYVNYLFNYFGINTVVVFDGYSDTSKNIKAMEQCRRAAAFPSSFEVQFNEAMEVPFTQEKFLSNRLNKSKLIKMLIRKLEEVNITTKQSRDDADVLIIETAIEISSNNATVIVGEDVDLIVLLMSRTQLHHYPIFFKKLGKQNVETKLYSSSSLNKYPYCKQHILFLHAITGCDTTSAIFRKGKIQILKIFEKRQDLHHLAEIFVQEECSPDIIADAGIHFILAIYGAPTSENSIDNYRYLSFAKSTKLSTAVKFPSLPPTAAAAQQHVYRVYYQIHTWLGKNIDPEQWGWTLKNNILTPVTTLLPPAPDKLLNTIFCICTKGCGGNCGCRKVGLKCSTVCGSCHDQSCSNTVSNSIENNDDFEVDTDLNPFDLLSTNIMETENESDEEETNNSAELN